MQMDYIDALLQASIPIYYRGHSLTIDNLIIDTSAAHSLLSSDVVSEIGIKFKNGDKLVRSFGFGGDEYSFRKRIDQLHIGDLTMEGINIDFGVFHDDMSYINGLIGLDILKSSNMIIDLHRMQMYPATSV